MTNQLNDNIRKINPTDIVTVSLKEHGTSFISSNILVRIPIRLNPVQKLINKHIMKKCKILHKQITKFKDKKNFYLSKINRLKSHKLASFKIDYGNVYSSRSVVKNEYINLDVTEGFYSSDIWGEYNKIIFPYIERGMTLYGEIVGYLTGSQKMIQRKYDYGCEEGTNYLMPYRITTKSSGEKKIEWEVLDVEKWTKKLIKEHPELKKNVQPIKILYHGTLADLYPEISVTEHWHENVLEALKNDKIHFGMEENEPFCKNKVPREGIVLRVYKDELSEAFKLKCLKFYEHEKRAIDKGEVDIEMTQGYLEEN